MNNSSYRLEVTAKKNGTFDHKVIEVATGAVVGTRNSKKHYTSATVVRTNLARSIAKDREILTWQGYKPEYYARVQQSLDEGLAMQAAGKQFPAGVYSFNSKPTNVPSYAAPYFDVLGYATETAS